jgi:RHS repeat-associated protein
MINIIQNQHQIIIRTCDNLLAEVNATGNIRKLHYISGGNGLAAIMVRNGGKDSLYYTYCDYQGNLLAVTDAAGTIKERYAYDPWGQRVNPSNWGEKDTRTSFLFSRGYTMHEHLDDFELINMNGRMYDPLVAQFLSPAPYVQAPGNWYNYNRYAYCMNNPLIYTDPSGEVFGIDDAIIIGMMIYMGGLYTNFMEAAQNNQNPFNPGNWNWKSPSTYIGMAAGGLAGYAQTLQYCEYLVDINTGEKMLYSHLGDGKFDFWHYGAWDESHTAFQLYNTVVKDVPLGGVSNIRSITSLAFVGPTVFRAGYSAYETSQQSSLIDEEIYKYNYATQQSMQALPSGRMDNIYPEFELLGLGKGLVNMAQKAITGKLAAKGGSKAAVQFGKTSNQVSHAFRHTDALGLDRSLVQSTIQNHFKTVSSQVVAGKPFNQIINIGGQRIQYTVYKLPDGTFNIGRIHGIK